VRGERQNRNRIAGLNTRDYLCLGLVLSETWGRKDDVGSDVVARPTCQRGKKDGGLPIQKEGEVGHGPLLLLGRSAAPQPFLFF
jgi:hypothetical protein